MACTRYNINLVYYILALTTGLRVGQYAAFGGLWHTLTMEVDFSSMSWARRVEMSMLISPASFGSDMLCNKKGVQQVICSTQISY